MQAEPVVYDTPEQIEAFRLLATLKGLEMEITLSKKHHMPPTALPTRGRALASARRILTQYNVPGTAWGKSRNASIPRTRAQCLLGMKWLLTQQGLLPKEN